MPELPEVETIRQGLLQKVIGRTISRAVVRLPKILIYPAVKQFSKALAGQTILDIQRRGKHLILHTEACRLLIHLGMTGQLTYRDQSRTDDPRFSITPHTGLQRARQHAVDRHTHITLFFNNGNAVHYRDIRQFGKWRLFTVTEFEQTNFFAKLGLEPFDSQYRLNLFLQKFKGRSLRIKSLLLNQSFVAGVGNIYADESLFEARIHPERSSETLTLAEKKRLFRAIPRVLARGLENGGTTLQDFLNADGEMGSNQEYLKVYGRKGEKCRRCLTLIDRIVVNQRSSHFCPRCQPLKPPVNC